MAVVASAFCGRERPLPSGRGPHRGHRGRRLVTWLRAGLPRALLRDRPGGVRRRPRGWRRRWPARGRRATQFAEPRLDFAFLPRRRRRRRGAAGALGVIRVRMVDPGCRGAHGVADGVLGHRRPRGLRLVRRPACGRAVGSASYQYSTERWPAAGCGTASWHLDDKPSAADRSGRGGRRHGSTDRRTTIASDSSRDRAPRAASLIRQLVLARPRRSWRRSVARRPPHRRRAASSSGHQEHSDTVASSSSAMRDRTPVPSSSPGRRTRTPRDDGGRRRRGDQPAVGGGADPNGLVVDMPRSSASTMREQNTS